jgi:hypothetical protein
VLQDPAVDDIPSVRASASIMSQTSRIQRSSPPPQLLSPTTRRASTIPGRRAFRQRGSLGTLGRSPARARTASANQPAGSARPVLGSRGPPRGRGPDRRGSARRSVATPAPPKTKRRPACTGRDTRTGGGTRESEIDAGWVVGTGPQNWLGGNRTSPTSRSLSRRPATFPSQRLTRSPSPQSGGAPAT